MNKPDEHLSKAQLLVVLRRKDAYGKPYLLNFLREKYPDKEFPDNFHFKDLTKREAQALIVGFKPRPKGYVRPKGKRRQKRDD